MDQAHGDGGIACGVSRVHTKRRRPRPRIAFVVAVPAIRVQEAERGRLDRITRDRVDRCWRCAQQRCDLWKSWCGGGTGQLHGGEPERGAGLALVTGNAVAARRHIVIGAENIVDAAGGCQIGVGRVFAPDVRRETVVAFNVPRIGDRFDHPCLQPNAVE